MKLILGILVPALLASGAFAQSSNPPALFTTLTNLLAGTNLLVEAELQRIMVQDQDAQDEVDKWIRDNQAFATEGAGVTAAELNQKIRKRFEVIRTAYDDFIKRHPRHVEARLAYASFLGDLNDEEGEKDQLLAAKALDPSRPSIWNNLANYYGHNGEIREAFTHYEKAIELDPQEPVYYHNLGNSVFLFRRDAEAHYHFNEQQVFDRALTLYSNSMRLDPTNFPLATDVAQSYYGIKPTRLADALGAWTNAMRIAATELERQSVHLHLARWKLSAGRVAEARTHVAQVNDPMLEDLRARIAGNISAQEMKMRDTNAPAAGTNAPAAN